MKFKKYVRTNTAEMLDWFDGFDMTVVSVSKADQENGSPRIGDKIARNPDNHNDMWLVAEQYFKDNFRPCDLGVQTNYVETPDDMSDLSLTIGMKRVGLDFNPSKDHRVDIIKNAAADIIDTLLDELESFENKTEKYRQIDIASQYIESGCKHAVAALFIKE